ncbi:hypothetical protein MRX96_055465 [Rhipicephalus microplus]
MADDDEPLMPRRDSTVAAGVLDDSEMNGEPLSEASPLRANYCLAVRITASVLCCAALVVAAIVAGMFLDTTFKREAPGDFEVTVSTISSSSVVLVVSVPLIKNGALDRCYITYNHTGGGRIFSCNDHRGNASTVKVEGLKPETDYAFTVTFVNIHGGRQAATQKDISVTTLAPLKGHKNLTDNVEFWLVLALIAFILLKSDNRPRRRRSRQRR